MIIENREKIRLAVSRERGGMPPSYRARLHTWQFHRGLQRQNAPIKERGRVTRVVKTRGFRDQFVNIWVAGFDLLLEQKFSEVQKPTGAGHRW